MNSELVNAWSAWELWCSRSSRRRSFTGREGKVETARLVSAEIAAALELGVPHTVVHMRIAEGRREGLSIEQAVGRALT